jgi:hypothetical protein
MTTRVLAGAAVRARDENTARSVSRYRDASVACINEAGCGPFRVRLVDRYGGTRTIARLQLNESSPLEEIIAQLQAFPKPQEKNATMVTLESVRVTQNQLRS